MGCYTGVTGPHGAGRIAERSDCDGHARSVHPLGIGLSVGLALALTLAYLTRSQHYGLIARNPFTFVCSVVVAKSLLYSPSRTNSNLRLLRFRTGAESSAA